MIKKLVIIAIAILFLNNCTASFADTKSYAQNNIQAKNESINIPIKNFGKVDNNYYRGAHPSDNDYKTLSALGIKTIIDLRHYFVIDKDRILCQKIIANNLGMNYINLPLLPYKPPTNEQIEHFFSILENPNNKPAFVFCMEGKDRTGIMTALYRVKYYNWNYDKTYFEMKVYGYHNLLYPRLKFFLRDYIKTSNSKREAG